MGDSFKEVDLSSLMEPEEAESTTLAIDYNRNEPWIPQEIVALLTFDLCEGWKHFADLRNNWICVYCRSPEAARYLKWKIDMGPMGDWIKAYFLPEEESQPAPSLN